MIQALAPECEHARYTRVQPPRNSITCLGVTARLANHCAVAQRDAGVRKGRCAKGLPPASPLSPRERQAKGLTERGRAGWTIVAVGQAWQSFTAVCVHRTVPRRPHVLRHNAHRRARRGAGCYAGAGPALPRRARPQQLAPMRRAHSARMLLVMQPRTAPLPPHELLRLDATWSRLVLPPQ